MDCGGPGRAGSKGCREHRPCQPRTSCALCSGGPSPPSPRALSPTRSRLHRLRLPLGQLQRGPALVLFSPGPSGLPSPSSAADLHLCPPPPGTGPVSLSRPVLSGRRPSPALSKFLVRCDRLWPCQVPATLGAAVARLSTGGKAQAKGNLSWINTQNLGPVKPRFPLLSAAPSPTPHPPKTSPVGAPGAVGRGSHPGGPAQAGRQAAPPSPPVVLGRQWSSLNLGFPFWKMFALRIEREAL